MSIFEAIKSCYKKMLNPDGRAARAEFWYFALFAAAMMALVTRLFGASDTLPANFVTNLVYVGCGLPLVTCGMRRMHDIGKAAGWIFLSLVPVVGWIITIWWCAKDSQEGENEFGLNPKGIGNPEPGKKKKKKKKQS